ncbi:MAG TPA: hypothetical protein VN999_03380 [Thermoanaerobaculia bacterium]|nr:hypothetical protein [Thermoanaerobaculia bacterium]
MSPTQAEVDAAVGNPRHGAHGDAEDADSSPLDPENERPEERPALPDDDPSDGD